MKVYFFGESWCTVVNAGTKLCTTGDPNFIQPPNVLGGPAATSYAPNAEWPLINGWLLVEVKWASDGLWHGVTKEWLQLGFARGVQVPTAPGTAAAQATNQLGATGSNFLTDHKNAMLYFQMTADRNGDGTVVTADAGDVQLGVCRMATTTSPLVNSSAQSRRRTRKYNWYPINLYDAREGENNDVAGTFGQTTGTPNGLMNSVELDVGNLKNWLKGLTGTPTGANVDYITQNGYIPLLFGSPGHAVRSR